MSDADLLGNDPSKYDPEGTGAGNHAEGDDRSLKNVMGEFNRKLQQQQEQFNTQMNQIAGAVKSLADNINTAQTPPAQPSQPRTITDYSLGELEAARANVMENGSDAEKAAFENAVLQKQINESVVNTVNQMEAARQTKQLETAYTGKIADAYGEHGIFQEGSALNLKFNEKLHILKDAGMLNPASTYTAAAEAAQEMGLSVSQKETPPTANLASGATNAPVQSQQGARFGEEEIDDVWDSYAKKFGLTEEDRKDVSQNYQQVMADREGLFKSDGGSF